VPEFTADIHKSTAKCNCRERNEAEKGLVSAASLGGDEMREAHRILAIIYSVRGDKKRQLNELETYLRLAPKSPDAEQIRQVISQLKGPG